MAKKRKQILKTPKLCFTDKLLYFLLFAVSVTLCAMAWMGTVKLRTHRMLDGIADAAAFKSTLGELLCVPSFILPGVMVTSVLGYGLKIRKPILGDRKIRYGSEGLREIYPIIGPRRGPAVMNSEEKAFVRKLTAVCLCLLLMAGLLVIPGTGCGTRLYTDGSMDTTGIFGRTAVHAPDIETVSFTTAAGIGYRVTLEYADGADVSFRAADFLIPHHDALHLIYHLSKEMDPSVYTCSEPVPREDTAVALQLTREEYALLLQLLDVTDTGA